jgi:hypothetical protein
VGPISSSIVSEAYGYCSYPSPGEHNEENRIQFQRATAKGHQGIIQLLSERVLVLRSMGWEKQRHLKRKTSSLVKFPGGFRQDLSMRALRHTVVPCVVQCIHNDNNTSASYKRRWMSRVTREGNCFGPSPGPAANVTTLWQEANCVPSPTHPKRKPTNYALQLAAYCLAVSYCLCPSLYLSSL